MGSGASVPASREQTRQQALSCRARCGRPNGWDPQSAGAPVLWTDRLSDRLAAGPAGAGPPMVSWPSSSSRPPSVRRAHPCAPSPPAAPARAEHAVTPPAAPAPGSPADTGGRRPSGKAACSAVAEKPSRHRAAPDGRTRAKFDVIGARSLRSDVRRSRPAPEEHSKVHGSRMRSQHSPGCASAGKSPPDAWGSECF